MAGLVTTFGSGAMTNSIKEIDGAKTLFVIGANTTIGGNVWLTESVPANTRVMLETPKLVYK